MPKHEFGIVDLLDKNKIYDVYEPEMYGCISVDDDLILKVLNKLNMIPTYYLNFQQAAFGLAYHGVTLISPSSLSSFENILLSEKVINRNSEISQYILIVRKAIAEEKYMIHFGI